MAITAGLKFGSAKLHLRLHCTRSVGQLFQFRPIDRKISRLEQIELQRADLISAPSRITLEATKQLYELRPDISVYPNPVPQHTHINPSISLELPEKFLLFVGRPHDLKGFYFLLKLAATMLHINFVFLIPNISFAKYIEFPPNVTFLDARSISKYQLYQNAKATIIPSLFETASMVGIESISCGTPLIAWSHLGISEYVSDEHLVKVEPWDIQQFQMAIDKVYHSTNKPKPDPAFESDINQRFIDGLTHTYDLRCVDHMPIKIGEKLPFPNLFNASLAEILSLGADMNKNNSRWRRKLRKLIHDPKLFFRDSHVWSAFTRTTRQKAAFLSNEAQMRKRTLMQHNNQEDGVAVSIDKLHQPGHVPLPPEIVVVANNNSAPAHFVKIGSGRIEFKDPPAKPVGLITALLYHRDNETDVNVIIEELNTFTDFNYVRSPSLQTGTFERSESLPLEIIDRIDVKNKKIISSVDHMILINPPSSIVTSLRSCGTRQRTIVVLTDGKAEVPDYWHTDVLITVGKESRMLAKSTWRRKINVQKLLHVHLAIRRAIQEGAPKHTDVFLPLKGFEGFNRDELMSLDRRFHQGFIRIKSGSAVKGKTMSTIIDRVTRDCVDFAVTESVYLRYKNLCDGELDSKKLASLISFCLYDGVLFDVRT
ncbi:glycosyltransferase family 4 protein [Brucella pseudogrignonensis]|uniref:glycosyltransferase family 4 protein n=1 Tax=Brucella pseudogrignonensis TaxID=419475 RepID=UPI003D975437